MRFVPRPRHAEDDDSNRSRPMCREVNLLSRGSQSSCAGGTSVAPIAPGLRRCASERPQPDALVIDAEQVRKAPDHSVRVRSQSPRIIEQVLRRVVGGVSDEGVLGR